MKRTLPAIALITGLTLAGCSGGQDGGQDEDGSDSAAEEATQLDEATLKELLESTDAQGQSFTYIDTSEAPAARLSRLSTMPSSDPASARTCRWRRSGQPKPVTAPRSPVFRVTTLCPWDWSASPMRTRPGLSFEPRAR